MKTELTCAIARDLMPSYADGLTSGDSNRALEAHLAVCPDCAARLAAMRGEAAPAGAETAPQIDYLKKVRRRGRLTVWLAAICVALAALFGALFLRAQPVSPDALASYTLTVEGRTVSFSGALAEGAGAFRGVRFHAEDGVLTLTVRASAARLFSGDEFSVSCTADDEIRQVRMDDRILWEDGMTITRTASRAYAAKTPYMGDISADHRVAAALGVSERFGPFTNSLQTGAEPYGWRIILQNEIPPEDVETAVRRMRADACVLLALIGNLGEITWEYPTAQGAAEIAVTVADASALAGRDIKTCAQSAKALQTLLWTLGWTAEN